MKTFLFLLLLATSAWASGTADIVRVDLTYGEANAQFQKLADNPHRTQAENDLYLALTTAIISPLPILQAQLATAEKNLADVSPKEFINPKWWPAVQQLHYAQQQLAAFRPYKDSDIVFYYTVDF